MSMIVVSGGGGFIGSHFVKMVREQPDIWATPLLRRDWNIRHPWPYHYIPRAKYFVHFAANVRARQSIDHPEDFILDNCVGTFNVLELARKIQPELFVYISSAEALGGCLDGYLPEDAAPRPSNPYAASKACGELLTYTYFRSYKLPAIIVRTQCVWSLEQSDPTKAVPIMKQRILDGLPVAILVKNGVIGSRQWIKVDDFCARLLVLLPKAVQGQTYHIVGEERNNLEMAQLLADSLGRPLLTNHVEISSTHELRYAIRPTL